MKWATSITSVLTFAGPSIAAAIGKRQSYNITDVQVLNFALTLEHLEDRFYREGLANYTEAHFTAAGFDRTFYRNLKEISFDETTHVSFLTGALTAAGAPAVAECTYNFGTTDVAGFIGLASVLEGVGVSAYLGAAAAISSKAYLTAAASILSIEAKHTSYLRASLGKAPFPQPFDAPLSPSQVYTLASQFIVSCPKDNPPFLPVVAFPPLTASSDDQPIVTGSTITLTVVPAVAPKMMVKRQDESGIIYAAFAALGGSVFVPTTSISITEYEVVIPAGINGQSYVALTSGRNDTDGGIIAGPALVEIAGTVGNPNSTN
ncbi:hypothetical protein EJ08DRAFT_669878 [Tothia fuscella]|uniref:Uncharacterized protein n=1 Tax=Tothia fuscella TaxID=1048955 RepID=A0A9P4TZJ9_9PEZI|nr:hypothetical protein EJ08DRAFT_669878 [Tothia fuscella]